jgi:hypothetical protein
MKEQGAGHSEEMPVRRLGLVGRVLLFRIQTGMILSTNLISIDSGTRRRQAVLEARLSELLKAFGERGNPVHKGAAGASERPPCWA